MEHTETRQIKFFDRPEVTDALLKRINAFKNRYRQNIAILGPQNIGKTTLVFETLRRSKCQEIIPIYLSIKVKSLENFANNFMGILLYQYLSRQTKSLEEEETLNSFIEKGRKTVPKTVHAILQIKKMLKEKHRQDEIFSSLLELPQILFDETQKPIILIMDEFHNLEHLGITNPFLELSNKIMVQKYTMYIMISSLEYASEKILTEKLSLLFGNFEIIKLRNFDAATAKEFINFKLLDIDMPENLTDFLVFFTGGSPFYLDIILEQIKYNCIKNNQKICSEEILIGSLSEIMYKEYGIINQFFNNSYCKLLDTRQINVFTLILLAIADGKKKLAQIGTALNRKNSEVNKYLNKLIETDIVVKKGVFNHICDPLFLHWLKFVLKRKQKSFSIDVEDSTAGFESDIKQLYHNFSMESMKETGKRIKELFELFENDIIELAQKRFMLARFDCVDLKDINDATLIRARRSNKSWFCYVEEKFIDEIKINDFLESTKRKDCVKKILVPLNGIEVNAKLKALEAKSWIWEKETLNELFSLFEKPRFLK